MTELNDHLKLLFARAAQLFDKQTALPVRHDTPETIYAELLARARGRRPAAGRSPSRSNCRPTPRAEQIEQWLSASGFTRVQAERDGRPGKKLLDVVADRFRLGSAEKVRVIEAIELALKRGSGRLNVYALDDEARARAVALLHRPALPRERPALRRPAAGAVQLQLGLRRLRDLPRLRPRDRRRPGAW